MSNHYGFDGRVALVTGGASGIGAAPVEPLREGGGEVHGSIWRTATTFATLRSWTRPWRGCRGSTWSFAPPASAASR